MSRKNSSKNLTPEYAVTYVAKSPPCSTIRPESHRRTKNNAKSAALSYSGYGCLRPGGKNSPCPGRLKPVAATGKEATDPPDGLAQRKTGRYEIEQETK